MLATALILPALVAGSASARSGTKLTITGAMHGPLSMARYRGQASPWCNYSSHVYALNFYARNAGHLLYGGAFIQRYHGPGTYRSGTSFSTSLVPAGTSDPVPWGYNYDPLDTPASVIRVARNHRSGTLDFFLSAFDAPSPTTIEVRGHWTCRSVFRVGR